MKVVYLIFKRKEKNRNQMVIRRGLKVLICRKVYVSLASVCTDIWQLKMQINLSIPSDGSADSKFAIWAAEASRPSQSSGPSSESSPTSNPDKNPHGKVLDNIY